MQIKHQCAVLGDCTRVNKVHASYRQPPKACEANRDSQMLTRSQAIGRSNSVSWCGWNAWQVRQGSSHGIGPGKHSYMTDGGDELRWQLGKAATSGPFTPSLFGGNPSTSYLILPKSSDSSQFNPHPQSDDGGGFSQFTRNVHRTGIGRK